MTLMKHTAEKPGLSGREANSKISKRDKAASWKASRRDKELNWVA